MSEAIQSQEGSGFGAQEGTKTELQGTVVGLRQLQVLTELTEDVS